MSAHYVDVVVEPHEQLPDGLCLRYKADGAAWVVHAIDYEPDDGPDGRWLVCGVGAEGETAAQAVAVQDSSAGTSTLVWGGSHGLLLRWADDPQITAREAYLLLEPAQVLG